MLLPPFVKEYYDVKEERKDLLGMLFKTLEENNEEVKITPITHIINLIEVLFNEEEEIKSIETGCEIRFRSKTVLLRYHDNMVFGGGYSFITLREFVEEEIRLSNKRKEYIKTIEEQRKIRDYHS